ncbi:hypothetical protein NA78x_001827 [Anatilimnocola sp. NA78]|uniref:hypothetical protein n=1 Tax=Anatilimnocola sp. NA78 TaxID=3415683 RepID=UPI003CE4874C
MKSLSLLGVLAAAAITSVPFQTAEAGRHNCGCCGAAVYAAPVAASPAAAATAPTPSVAQNQPQGYRSYSYQPSAAPVMNYSSGNNYYRSSNRRSNQPMWMNGGNKSLGRYN